MESNNPSAEDVISEQSYDREFWDKKIEEYKRTFCPLIKEFANSLAELYNNTELAELNVFLLVKYREDKKILEELLDFYWSIVFAYWHDANFDKKSGNILLSTTNNNCCIKDVVHQPYERLSPSKRAGILYYTLMALRPTLFDFSYKAKDEEQCFQRVDRIKNIIYALNEKLHFDVFFIISTCHFTDNTYNLVKLLNNNTNSNKQIECFNFRYLKAFALHIKETDLKKEETIDVDEAILDGLTLYFDTLWSVSVEHEYRKPSNKNEDGDSHTTKRDET